MCLYPKLIKNKKYEENKKNGGIIPPIFDKRVLYVPVGCGNCIECRKQKAREWQVRLQQEIKDNPQAWFVTLTFNEESLIKLEKELDTKDAESIAQVAIRRFTERWRKRDKKALRHWLITELGHKGTERLHFHGLIWCENKNDIKTFWQYGFIFVGKYVNEKTINYITKYVTKIDTDHKGYKPKIFASKGIGAGYLNSTNFIKARYQAEKTKDYYTTTNGARLAQPIYYRNKRYTDEEKEKLWCQRLDKDERYVLGNKISNVSTKEGQDEYIRQLMQAQERNIILGYGDRSDEWSIKKYNASREVIKDITLHGTHPT